jgi:hypothetical protein
MVSSVEGGGGVEEAADARVWGSSQASNVAGLVRCGQAGCSAAMGGAEERMRRSEAGF